MNEHPSSRFRLRGMHLNGWAINYPYTFRCWREEDWYRYLDLLHQQGINLFLFWPFMEIMPTPLSPEDTEYLAECRRVVAYAQQRGMEVWIMQSANRVALNDCGVKDPRKRPYWNLQVQVDHNPGDPEQMQRILAARETLYRHLGNADGYLTIDSDPGSWPGSPVEEFLRIFEESRELLDRYTVHGTETKQICWLWFGWHHDGDPEVLRAQIQGVKRLAGPWAFVCGRKELLPLCREFGVLEKTVYLQYNLLEDEPSLPFTRVRFDWINDMFREVEDYPELAGIMANVQCPLLQLPNCYQYWQLLFAPPSKQLDLPALLLELASRIYPDQAGPLADSFAALDSTDTDTINRSMQALARGREEGAFHTVGDIGQYLFPEPTQLVDDLIYLLQIRAAQETIRQVCSAQADVPTILRALTSFLDRALAWDACHAYHTLFQFDSGDSYYGLGLMPSFPHFSEMLDQFRTALGQDAEQLSTLFRPIGETLQNTYPPDLVWKGCVNPLIKLLSQDEP